MHLLRFLFNKDPRVYGKIFMEVSSVLGQNNPSVVSIIELDKYLSENLLNRQLDPLKWWYDRKQRIDQVFMV